jgi:F420-0:gamma-glutamyl ligase
MSAIKKIPEWIQKIIKEQYDVTIYLSDGQIFPNGSTHIVVQLKKIKKLNSKYLSGTDINGRSYEFSSVEDFNYEVKKIY